MNRAWQSSLVVLALFLALLFSVVPFIQSAEHPKYTYRDGCPVWEPEEKRYCPERYQSLISAKSNYAKGEEVRITLTNLEDFEYKVNKVEVHFKPLFEHDFNLIYTEKDLGSIPRSENEWTWNWDQKNSAGEQVGAGRAYVRVTFDCCKNYRVYFRISQAGGGEISVPEEESEQAETVQIPNRPGNFDYRVFSPAEVELSWNDNSDNEDGFRIYRNGNRIATLGPNSISYTDTEVASGESYNYRVSAYNEAGESSTSQSLTVQLGPDALGSPGGLSYSELSPTEVRLTWNDNSDNEDGFRIYRNGNRIATVGANVTSYTDADLMGDTEYTYRVSSFNDGGETPLTGGLQVTTPHQVPTTPGGMSSDILSPTEVRLTWRDNSDNEDGFRIYRNGDRVAEVGSNTTSYVDTGLSENTSYTYRVSSYNESGESSRSSRMNVTTPVKIPSSPGQLRTETISPSEIELTWRDNSDNEDGFRIYRNGGMVATVPPNTTSYRHEDLSGESRYCYEVVSYNDSGESEPTNRNCSMTLESLPDSPGNVSATAISSTRIRLTWRDNSDNEDGFNVYRNGEEIATLGPNTTSYIDRDLDPGIAYSYEVSAYNRSGESGLSGSGTVMTQEPEPEPEPEPQPEPEPEPPISQQQLLAGVGVVLMVMGYIYAEMG